ncbi:MAG TPA: 50S ribosomal protein L17 [Lentisphaeria bacterium]|nr:MAG: 50S ribosomal protein L17 [Lentisphaerae bacterium GWF2_38_69]HBM15508.1 50S ribosomal protein L17 [Lentisphaeria bacterium]
MRHRKKTFKIGRTDSHRKSLLANQVCCLISSKEITTTLVKAKETKRIAEKMVTLAKSGTLHDRRRAISKLGDTQAVKILFEEIGPAFKDRNGGYSRIIQLGPRIGDAAEMCILQWVNTTSGEAPNSTSKEKAADK